GHEARRIGVGDEIAVPIIEYGEVHAHSPGRLDAVAQFVGPEDFRIDVGVADSARQVGQAPVKNRTAGDQGRAVETFDDGRRANRAGHGRPKGLIVGRFEGGAEAGLNLQTRVVVVFDLYAGGEQEAI